MEQYLQFHEAFRELVDLHPYQEWTDTILILMAKDRGLELKAATVVRPAHEPDFPFTRFTFADGSHADMPL